jgi:hypothetical protein
MQTDSWVSLVTEQYHLLSKLKLVLPRGWTFDSFSSMPGYLEEAVLIGVGALYAACVGARSEYFLGSRSLETTSLFRASGQLWSQRCVSSDSKVSLD